jgi:hypothetical protein
MLYKFKSAAAGDVIMLGPQGNQLLQLLGREPEPKGIFEVADMPSLQARLEVAIAGEAPGAGMPEEDQAAQPAVVLRQRLWPMIDMLRRCHAAGEPIVWGV